MTWWEALVLGVVQGITEFFPVSSSGHLVMTERLLGLELPGTGFAVVVHVATLLSVIVVYRQRLLNLCLGCLGLHAESGWPYVLKLIVATVPAALVGLLFKDWFEARFDDPRFTGTMLLVTGTFLWSTRWTGKSRIPGWKEWVPVGIALVVSVIVGSVVPFVAVLGLEVAVMAAARFTAPPEVLTEPRMGGAILMGVAQAIAIFPGISRSGSTVVTGLWRRIDAVAAAEFSFLMSIPAILGAAVLDVPEVISSGFGVPALPLIIGFVAAAVSGVLAIRYFVALLKRQNFHSFAWYCWAAGTVFLLTL
jgi:undecaprenyl-diphosphatase